MGDLVSPRAERSLRVLHDVPLVDEGHGPASIPNGVADCLSNEALRTRLADRLQADSAVRPDLRLELLLQDLDHTDRLGRSFFPFDARVDVLRALAEDDHVEALRMRHGTRHPGDPIDGPHVRVQVEGLPEGYVQGPESATDGGRHRALERDDVLPDRPERALGRVLAIQNHRLPPRAP